MTFFEQGRMAAQEWIEEGETLPEPKAPAFLNKDEAMDWQRGFRKEAYYDDSPGEKFEYRAGA